MKIISYNDALSRYEWTNNDKTEMTYKNIEDQTSVILSYTVNCLIGRTMQRLVIPRGLWFTGRSR